MLNHLSNSNGTLSMESISEIIDHQTLSRQLVEDTSDLMVQHTLAGRTPSPTSSVTALSTHDGGIDEHEVATTTSVALDSAHTIIDHHCPTYQMHRIQQHHLHHHQEQQQKHLHHSQQQLALPQRLQLESPVHFVASDNTLDSLSVGSTGSSGMGHIIAVKQEQKLVIVNCNSNGSSNHNNNNNNNSNNNRNNHKHNNKIISCERNKSNCDLGVVLDDLTTDDHSTMDSTDQHNYDAHDVHMESESHHHPSTMQMRHQKQRYQHTHDTSTRNEQLTVIVEHHEDSRDSSTQVLSPPELGVVGVAENSLGTSSFQTLTSVVNDEPLSPPDFSSSSAYATLTPLQPLPPISTMSEKFAYGGHISGGGVINSSNTNDATTHAANENSPSNGPTGVVSPYVMIPGSHHSQSHEHSQHQQHHPDQHHQNSLNSLSLSGLSGEEPSPYSPYDKLPTMGMSMTPPHNYGSSPSHTLSGIIVSCDLPPASPSGCGPMSPQSAYSHSTEVQSPPQETLTDCKDSSLSSKANIATIGCNTSVTSSSTQKRNVVCLSPVAMNGGNVLGDHVIVNDYARPFSCQQRELIVPNTSSASASGGHSGCHLHMQPVSPEALSPHSVPTSSMHSPGTVMTIPRIASNGGMTGLANSSSRSLMNNTSMQRHQYQQQQHVVSLTPSPPIPSTASTGVPRTLLMAANHVAVANNCDTAALSGRLVMINGGSQETHLLMQTSQQQQPSSKSHPLTSECTNNGQHQQTQIAVQSQQQQQQLVQNQQQQQQHNEIQQHSNKHNNVSSSNNANGSGGGGDMEEINTKELAQRISAELKRYSIPQAIFAQRVLCRSQGTLSDLLRNPKPWSKLKSGRETFRRMFKWLQEPEFQRMSALRMAAAQIPQRSSNGQGTSTVNNSLNPHIVDNSRHEDFDLDFAGTTSLSGISTLPAAQTGTGISAPLISAAAAQCRRKDEPQMEHMPQPKKPRLVFTDLQRRTLQAIFKETKRPSKEMQVTIARQLGLEPTTVGNFFMNARRRSMDKWRDDESNMTGNSESKNMTNQTTTRSNNRHSLHGQHDGRGHSCGGSQYNNRNNISNIHIQLSSSNHHHHSTSLELDDEDDDSDMDLDLIHDDFELNDDNIDDTHHHKDDDDML